MGGLKVRKNFVPTFDSTVVKKLGLAGAVLLGRKSGSTEGALSGYNPEFKIPKNPWGDELWAEFHLQGQVSQFQRGFVLVLSVPIPAALFVTLQWQMAWLV